MSGSGLTVAGSWSGTKLQGDEIDAPRDARRLRSGPVRVEVEIGDGRHEVARDEFGPRMPRMRSGAREAPACAIDRGTPYADVPPLRRVAAEAFDGDGVAAPDEAGRGCR